MSPSPLRMVTSLSMALRSTLTCQCAEKSTRIESMVEMYSPSEGRDLWRRA
jgi:hypothetical protein